MLRIGSMNLLLHGVENSDIRYQDWLIKVAVTVVGTTTQCEVKAAPSAHREAT